MRDYLQPRLFTASTLIFVGLATSIAVMLFCAPDGMAKKSKGANTAEPAEQNFNDGVSRFKSKDWDGAVDSFLQATYFARNGYNPEAYYWLGKSYMARRDDIKALDAFKKSVTQSMKKSPQAHIYMAEIYLRNDRDEESNDEAKNALKDADGPCPEGHLLIAKILTKHGAFTEAEMQYQDALGDHPWKFTEAWMCYAESMMKAKNWVGAFNMFEKLLEAQDRLHNVDMPQINYDMGLCTLARGDHQGAIDHFHAALALDPNNFLSHLELAILFESEKHYSSAIKEYSEFVRLAPGDNPKVLLAKDRIQMLNQKLSVEAAPAVVAPSPYMREQQQLQQQMQIKRMQQSQAPKDPGF